MGRIYTWDLGRKMFVATDGFEGVKCDEEMYDLRIHDSSLNSMRNGKLFFHSWSDYLHYAAVRDQLTPEEYQELVACYPDVPENAFCLNTANKLAIDDDDGEEEED